MPEGTDAAFIVFSWDTGHRRYRLPAHHKIVFKKDGSATLRNDSGSLKQDIGFNWQGKVNGERAQNSPCSSRVDNLARVATTIENAWAKYTAGDGEDIGWPILHQPTALDSESLKDALTPVAIRHFFIDFAHSSLRSVSTRERIQNALQQWRWENIQGKTRDLDEQQRQAVEEGVSIVAKALEDLLEELEPKAQDI